MHFAYVMGGFHLVCLHSGKGFFMDRIMNCPTGGYPTLRHNELTDLLHANALSEVCFGVFIADPFR